MTKDEIAYLKLLDKYLKRAEKHGELVDIEELDFGRFLLIVIKFLLKERRDEFKGPLRSS